MTYQLEICCTSFESAYIAQKAGANRIELCDNILEGGTTPSAGLIARIKEELDIPVHVLIRPRGGDFCYSEDDYKVMQLDIAACWEIGVDGIVCGILNENLTVDEGRTLDLLELTGDMDFTFHRAFDLVPNQFKALEQLNDLGVTRILTSGGANNVAVGATRIRKLTKVAGNEIKIMAGGGLNAKNIDTLLATGCQEFHTTAKEWVVRGVKNKVRMNGLAEIPENRYLRASAVEINKIMAKMNAFRK